MSTSGVPHEYPFSLRRGAATADVALRGSGGYKSRYNRWATRCTRCNRFINRTLTIGRRVQSLQPHFDKLGKQFRKHHDAVVIAKARSA